MAIKKKAGRISPVLMGDYDNTTVYRRLDWVKYGGTSYICKKNNTTGIAPSDPDRWQKIIDEANLNIPNYWQMTSKNGKGTFVQVGTKWIVTVPTMTQVSDAATAYWGVKLAAETEYTIQFGISNGTNDDSVYVNVSDTQGSHYQFSNIGNGDVIKYVRIPQDAWVWMKFQHYSNTTDTYAYLILEPVTPIDKHRILFEEASARQNISSTDNLSTILGKIKKYFSDLKTVAFTGKYTDLVDTPSIKITDNGNDTHIYLGESERVLGLENQLAAVNFKNEGGGPNQGMRFITRQPNSGDIIFGNITGDTDLTFPFSFGVDANGYGYKKHKSNNITHFGDIYAKNVLNTTEQISANTATGYVAGALAAKAMMADYNAKINQVNSNFTNKAEGYFYDWGDCNDLKFGIYLTHKTANTPTDSDWHMIISCNDSSITGIQVGIPLIINPNIYVRVCSARNWLEWRSIC